MSKFWVLFLGVCVSVAFADTKEVVREALVAVDPSIPISSIDQSEMAGFSEVLLGSGEVLFVSDDGQYIISGTVYQKGQNNRLVNLTDKRMSVMRLEALQQVDDVDMVIFPAKGETKARVSVFTDIDCPYCKKLHDEVDALNDAGIEVAYLAFPRSGAGGATAARMDAIWCADDPLDAMEKALDGDRVASTSCETPVLDQLALGQSLGVNGTPALILEDGSLLPGYMPAERIKSLLGLM